jgi:peptidoglycan/xylan/chitin deacetylase (PgdA/CDA1 family)
VRADGLPILVYHGVASAAKTPAERFTVSLDDFTRHMDAVAASARAAMRISELSAPLSRGEPMSASAAAVTFDDGTADFYEHAWPVLRERALTVTLYVTSGLVDGRFDGRQMLTWEQLEELRDGGVEIGAHSQQHIALDVVSVDRAARHLVNSKLELEQRLGVAVNSFAYPFGYHTPALKRLVARTGYTSACAVKNALSHPRDDRFALARFMLTADTTCGQVERLLSGEGAPVAWTGERLRTRLWRVYRRTRALSRETASRV